MAKTRSRKQREHVLRNLGRDVTQFRGENGFSTHVRKTKTKQEKIISKDNKYKKQFRSGENPMELLFYLVNNHFATNM